MYLPHKRGLEGAFEKLYCKETTFPRDLGGMHVHHFHHHQSKEK